MDGDGNRDERGRDGNGDGAGDGEYAASSDKMFELLGELRAVEAKKREAPLGSPEFVGLAREAEHLSRLVFRWSEFQRGLADESPDRRDHGNLSGRPIETIGPRQLDRILADWREADLRLSQARPGTDEARRAADAIEALREEYRRAQDRKRD